MTEQPAERTERQIPFSEPFKQFICEGWEPYPAELPAPLPATAWTDARRRAIAAILGQRLAAERPRQQ